jgi:hypothetical protein
MADEDNTSVRRRSTRGSPRRSSPRRTSTTQKRSSPRRSPRRSSRARNNDQLTSSSVGGSGTIQDKLFGHDSKKNDVSSLSALLGEEADKDLLKDDIREMIVVKQLRSLLDSSTFDSLPDYKKQESKEFIKKALESLGKSSNSYPQFTKSVLEKIYVDDAQEKTKGITLKKSNRGNDSMVLEAVQRFITDLTSKVRVEEDDEDLSIGPKKQKPLFSDEALLQMIEYHIDRLKRVPPEVPLLTEDVMKTVLKEEIKRRGGLVSGVSSFVAPNKYPITVEDLLNSTYAQDKGREYLFSLAEMMSDEDKEEEEDSLTSFLKSDGYNGYADGYADGLSSDDNVKVKIIEYVKLLKKKEKVGKGVSGIIKLFLGKIRGNKDDRDKNALLFASEVENLEQLYKLVIKNELLNALKDEKRKKRLGNRFELTIGAVDYITDFLLPVYLEVQILTSIERKREYYRRHFKLKGEETNEVIEFFNANKEKDRKELFKHIIDTLIEVIVDGSESISSEFKGKIQGSAPGTAAVSDLKKINEVTINMILFNRADTSSGKTLILLSNERVFFDLRLLDDVSTGDDQLDKKVLLKMFSPEHYNALYSAMTTKGKIIIPVPPPRPPATTTPNNVDLITRKNSPEEFDVVDDDIPKKLLPLFRIINNVANCIMKYYSEDVYGYETTKIIKRFVALVRQELGPLENELVRVSAYDRINVVFNIMYRDKPIPYGEILNKCFNRKAIETTKTGGLFTPFQAAELFIQNGILILNSIPSTDGTVKIASAGFATDKEISTYLNVVISDFIINGSKFSDVLTIMKNVLPQVTSKSTAKDNMIDEELAIKINYIELARLFINTLVGFIEFNVFSIGGNEISFLNLIDKASRNYAMLSNFITSEYKDNKLNALGDNILWLSSLVREVQQNVSTVNSSLRNDLSSKTTEGKSAYILKIGAYNGAIKTLKSLGRFPNDDNEEFDKTTTFTINQLRRNDELNDVLTKIQASITAAPPFAAGKEADLVTALGAIKDDLNKVTSNTTNTGQYTTNISSIKTSMEQLERHKSRLTRDYKEYGKFRFFIDVLLLDASLKYTIARYLELLKTIEPIQE